MFYGRDRKTPLSPRFILDGFYGALDQIDIDEDSGKSAGSRSTRTGTSSTRLCGLPGSPIRSCRE